MAGKYWILNLGISSRRPCRGSNSNPLAILVMEIFYNDASVRKWPPLFKFVAPSCRDLSTRITRIKKYSELISTIISNILVALALIPIWSFSPPHAPCLLVASEEKHTSQHCPIITIQCKTLPPGRQACAFFDYIKMVITPADLFSISRSWLNGMLLHLFWNEQTHTLEEGDGLEKLFFFFFATLHV